jgi:hypothetical protein
MEKAYRLARKLDELNGVGHIPPYFVVMDLRGLAANT